MEKQINIGLLYDLSKCKYYFRNITAIRSIRDIIFNGKVTISEADKK